jgi:hypothetical protein
LYEEELPGKALFGEELSSEVTGIRRIHREELIKYALRGLKYNREL